MDVSDLKLFLDFCRVKKIEKISFFRYANESVAFSKTRELVFLVEMNDHILRINTKHGIKHLELHLGPEIFFSKDNMTADGVMSMINNHSYEPIHFLPLKITEHQIKNILRSVYWKHILLVELARTFNDMKDEIFTHSNIYGDGYGYDYTPDDIDDYEILLEAGQTMEQVVIDHEMKTAIKES